MTTGLVRDATRTRATILASATEIVRLGDGSRLSVRAVAQRAGVGIGTLRYYFPTQRELYDAVLSAIYAEAMPDDRIRDTGLHARERLLESLRQVIAPIGIGMQARETWDELFRSFIAASVPTEQREAYIELTRQAHRRVESWLAILTEEGAIEAGDNAARARFLMTILNGLAIGRALPSDRAALELETEVLTAVVEDLIADGRE